MQQFVVPQFIDIEGKILGPITSRQFVLLIAWGILEFGAFKIFNTAFFVAASVFLGLFFGPMAFYRPNGKPFHYFLLSIYQVKTRASLRVWHRHYSIAKAQEIKSRREIREARKKENERQFAPKSTLPSKLSELSLIVDTGGVYEGEQTPEDLRTTMENIGKK